MVLKYDGGEWKPEKFTCDMGWWQTPEGDAQMVTEADPWRSAQELTVLRLEVVQKSGGERRDDTRFSHDVIGLGKV